MSLAIAPESPPLHQEPSGAFRIGNSRVLLELVVRAFQDGATPEAIAQAYPSLTLSEVYSVIAFYLRHPQEIAEYLAKREAQAAATQAKIEASQPDLSDIRERLRVARGR
jgi:uncharacterized protein (DUF433 family)